MDTQQLIDKAGLVLTPEISDPTNRYQMFNDGSVELETAQFLYAFIRIIKPENILETGTYKGVSSTYMALGLKDNGFGHLNTLEIESQHIQTSKELWSKAGISEHITSIQKSSLEYVDNNRYQFLFLDSEPNLRFKELVRFYDSLDDGGYIFIHDLHSNMSQGNINPDLPEYESWPYGNLPNEIINWVKEDRLRPFHFKTPRGLTAFYKTKKEDYQWR